MSKLRRQRRDLRRANIKHEPVIKSLLNEAIQGINLFEQNGIELTQMHLEILQNKWMVYCAECKNKLKGIAPDPNAFVINLFK